MRILFRIIGGSHTIKSYSKLTPSIMQEKSYNKGHISADIGSGLFHGDVNRSAGGAEKDEGRNGVKRLE